MYVHEKGDLVSDSITHSGRVFCDQGVVTYFELSASRGIKLTFLDIGSNVGSCAILAASLGHFVWAFEPLPMNYGLIERTLRQNDYFDGRFQLIKCGASNKKGNFDIYTLPHNKGHSTLFKQIRPDFVEESKTYVQYKCCTELIDEAIPDNIIVDLMKIDTEGHEYFVLEGATNLISNKSRTPLFIYYEHYGPLMTSHGANSDDIRNFFTSRSYTIRNVLPVSVQHDEQAVLCGVHGRRFDIC